MTHYTAADLERLSCDIKDVQTIFTFRNEQLLNLYMNEMQGQISDGMWENSRHTEWLWSKVIYRLGNETKVEVLNKWSVGRKSYPLAKELWEVIGDRLYGEHDETTAGYQTEKEVRAAWRELSTAIYNVTEIPYNSGIWLEKKAAEKEFQDKVQNLEARAKAERSAVTGNEDWYSSCYLNAKDRKGYVSIDIKTNPAKGTYYFIINKVFKVQEGHLAEGFEAVRYLYNNPGVFELVTLY